MTTQNIRLERAVHILWTIIGKIDISKIIPSGVSNFFGLIS